MFIEMKARLKEEPITELLSYSIFPDPERLEHAIREYQSSEELEILGYEVEGELIGLVGYRMNGEELELCHVAVDPSHRGLGYGRGQLLELMVRKQPKRVVCQTDEDSVNFFRAIGFEVRSLGELYPGVERFECFYEVDEEE
jgi:ribosomal protein S18 acetylase RimI-like enzyme